MFIDERIIDLATILIAIREGAVLKRIQNVSFDRNTWLHHHGIMIRKMLQVTPYDNRSKWSLEYYTSLKGPHTMFHEKVKRTVL